MQSDSYAPVPPAMIDVDLVLVAAGGFLATLVMTTAMYVLPLLGWGQVDLPSWIVRVFTSNAVTVGEAGVGVHLLVGLFYAWLFARQIEPRLTLAPAKAGVHAARSNQATDKTFILLQLGIEGAKLHR